MRTRTKTFRLDIDLLELLHRAAGRALVSENAFVSRTLADRLAVDPLFPAFQEIRLSAGTFQSVLNATNLDSLETGASEIAQRNFSLAHELYSTSGRPLNFKEFVETILGDYAHWFYNEADSNTDNQALILRHPYGLKWSRFLASYIVSARGIASKEKVHAEVEDQFIRVRLPPH